MQKFSQLFGKLPTKPTGAALLFEDPANGETRSFPLSDTLLVGRLSKNPRSLEGCDLALQDDQLSRKHFAITHSDEIYLLRDLNSRNGTFVNDQDEPVRESILKSGDIIFAGRMVFSFIGS
ncbi:MAG: FHA domain-containing protein [Rhodanobacteraceae bacterium]